jgi:hypothetical protein
MVYHSAWAEGLKRGSLRMLLPNGKLDPLVAHEMLNCCLDEFAPCDELELGIKNDKSHSTATCTTISGPMALAVIARETKRVQLLPSRASSAVRDGGTVY